MISIANVNSRPSQRFDARYAIVQKSNGRLPEGLDSCSIISPRRDLLNWYLRKKNATDEFGQSQWNREAFDKIYVPEFISQMRYDQRAANILNGLVELDKSGAKIQLCCFCPDETMCHRSIVAGLLQGAGCDVRTATGQDYSKYFDMYQNAPMTKSVAKYLGEIQRASQASPARTLGSEFDAIRDVPGVGYGDMQM